MAKIGYGKVLKVCSHCSIEFYARRDRLGRYCSRSCARRNQKQVSYKIEKICCECKKTFMVKRYRIETALFCSRKCLADNRGRRMRGAAHPCWKGGVAKRPYKSRKAIALAKKLKGSCEKCGSKENLQGHHRIKYSERPDLCDKIENIEVLCDACHSKEHPELDGMIMSSPLRRGIYNSCHVCNNAYYIPQYKIGKSRWCSRKCAINGLNDLRRKNE